MTAMMSFRKVSKVAQTNKKEIMVYCAVAMITTTVLTQFAFSMCLTLSSGIQCVGFSFLILQAYSGRDVSNVSLNSCVLYVVALGFRLFATLQYDGYQPMDPRTGKWLFTNLYHSTEIVEMLLAAGAFMLVRKMQAQYCGFSDETPHGTLVLLSICAVLAPLTHCHLNFNKLGDTTWIMGLYVETVAMIPQLYLLQKSRGEVEALHGHYIASTFISRLVQMMFWFECYTELKHPKAEYNVPGSMVIFAQVLQVFVYADFMYLYVKSVRNSQKLLIEM